MVVYEAWLPILGRGVSEETCIYWRNRTKESFDKMIDKFNYKFLYGVDPYTGESRDVYELVKDYMVKPSNENYKPFINEDYGRDEIGLIHYTHGIWGIPQYVEKITELKDKKDWYLSRVDEGYNKYVNNRNVIGALSGDRRVGFDCITILVGILTRSCYVKNYVRDIDRFSPSFWCFNIFGFNRIMMKPLLFNKLSSYISFYVKYFDNIYARNRIIEIINNFVENEIKPNVVSRYTLDKIEIIDSEYSKYGEIHVMITVI